MKPFPVPGLRAKVILILAPVVMIPLVLMSYLFFTQQASEMSRQVASQSERAWRTTEQALRQLDLEAGIQLQLLSQLPQIRQYFIVQDETQRDFLLYRPILETFRTWLSVQAAYEALIMTDKAGQPAVSLYKPGRKDATDTGPPGEQAWFGELSATPAGETFRTPLWNGQDLKLLYGRPIPMTTYSDWKTSSKQDIGGYLVLRVNLEPLARSVAQLALGKTGFAVLLGPDHAPLSQAETFLRSDLKALADLTAVQPEGTSLSAVELKGASYFTRLYELPYGLELMTVWPAKETVELAQKVARQTVLGLTVLIVLTGLVLLVLLHRILVRPILDLQDMAHDIGHNRMHSDNPDLDRHLATASRRDEIGALARAFQDMNINLRATSMKLRQIAYQDSLTGLANRNLFSSYLNKALAAAKRHHHHLVVMYIDIDGFKEVNDTLGHDAGDKVLQEIARRLRTCLREEDMISSMRQVSAAQDKGELSRIGGDEFAIILPHVTEPASVRLVAERVLDALRKPFEIHNRTYHLGASIGVAMYPLDGEEAVELLKRADIAMYQAKAKGKNQVEFYSQEMETKALERQNLLQDLRVALEAGQFELHYQPQLDLRSGRICAVEALLRWKHPEMGYIPPDRFIPVAEDSGLIVDIGQWVLDEACQAAVRLHEAGLPWLRVAVNFSTVQFRKTQDIVRRVEQSLTRHALNGRFLEVEITETAIMQSGEIALDTLLRLRELGTTIAMDDFGTGYSSLATLRDLPIDVLKIDKSFTDGILISHQGQAIVRAILAMTRELGIEVVAEGVEQAEQVAFFQLEHCHVLQGYHICRPMPEPDLAAWILNFDPALLSPSA